MMVHLSLLFTKHEEASVAIFEHLVETNDLMETFENVGLDDTDLIFIKELIYGPLDDNGGSVRRTL